MPHRSVSYQHHAQSHRHFDALAQAMPAKAASIAAGPQILARQAAHQAQHASERPAAHSARRTMPAANGGPTVKAGSAYTLGHAGRQVRLGPVAFWIVVGTLVIMAAWSITTVTYFAFQDDVLARIITRQTQMQLAYEDRIAELRTQVDRITSRQLLDQGQYERKLDQLLRRQAILEFARNRAERVAGSHSDRIDKDPTARCRRWGFRIETAGAVGNAIVSRHSHRTRRCGDRSFDRSATRERPRLT